MIILNPDEDFVNEVKKQIKECNGHCPCAIVRNKHTKCRCKDFRDMVDRGEYGACHCGLYINVKEDSDESVC